MKKKYITPAMTLVHIQHKGLLMESVFNVTSNNANLEYGGGSNSSARTREFHNVWEEEW